MSKSIGIGLSSEEKLRLSLSVELEQDGGSPSFFFDLLARAIREKIWDDLGDIDDFKQLVESPKPSGLGTTREAVLAMLSPHIKHRHEDLSQDAREMMRKLREDVIRLLTPDMNEIGAPEGSYNNPNGRAGKQTTNSVVHRISSVGANNDASYILARLKRDNPDLAEKVFTSELSPHKAGQIAGFIKPRQKFVPGNVKQTMGALKRHYDDEGYEQLQTAMIPKSIDQVAKAIKKRFQGDELKKLIELLSEI